MINKIAYGSGILGLLVFYGLPSSTQTVAQYNICLIIGAGLVLAAPLIQLVYLLTRPDSRATGSFWIGAFCLVGMLVNIYPLIHPSVYIDFTPEIREVLLYAVALASLSAAVTNYEKDRSKRIKV